MEFWDTSVPIYEILTISVRQISLLDLRDLRFKGCMVAVMVCTSQAAVWAVREE